MMLNLKLYFSEKCDDQDACAQDREPQQGGPDHLPRLYHDLF